MKKKNYVSKAVMLGALLAPIGMPTVSVLADSFYQNQTSAHAADITNWIASTPEQITNNFATYAVDLSNVRNFSSFFFFNYVPPLDRVDRNSIFAPYGMSHHLQLHAPPRSTFVPALVVLSYSVRRRSWNNVFFFLISYTS